MNETRVYVKTIGLVGLEPHLKTLEIHITPGSFTQLDVVGVGDNLRREMRVRVVAALQERGVSLEGHGVTVVSNRSDGTDVPDLAVAVGLLAAFGRIPLTSLEKTIFIGELSLEGRLRPVRGLSAMLVPEILPEGWQVIVPYENAIEAGFRPASTQVFLADDLGEVGQHLNGVVSRWSPLQEPEDEKTPYDLSELPPGIGRRALEVAAAGGHNMLLIGPPGSGKTMLARRLTSILPTPSTEEVLEWMRIHSVAGLVPKFARPKRSRPFRAPHHTVSEMGLLGGGKPARPGEVSLAHNGVLFLDEVNEFRKSLLQGLEQPLRQGIVSLFHQGERAVNMPASALIVAAANPCPCGYGSRVASSITRRCRCSDEQIASYFRRLDLPFVDLKVELPPSDFTEKTVPGESSSVVRGRVEKARILQLERYRRGATPVPVNGHLPADEVKRLVPGASVASVARIALTLADLEGVDVTAQHILEATELTFSSYHTTKGS